MFRIDEFRALLEKRINTIRESCLPKKAKIKFGKYWYFSSLITSTVCAADQVNNQIKTIHKLDRD